MMLAKYFEYYTIIYLGGRFFVYMLYNSFLKSWTPRDHRFSHSRW